MSDTSEKKLTINDPVTPEQLQRISDLTNARYDIADRLLDLEQQKVGLLVSARQVDEEKAKVFNKILMDRGLPPGTPVEIDGQTGGIVVRRPAPPSTVASVPDSAKA